MNRNFITSFLIATISYLIIFCQVPSEVRNERKEKNSGEVGYVQSQTIIFYTKFNKQFCLVFPYAMKKVQVHRVSFGLKKGKKSSSKICESVFPPYQETLSENQLISFLLFVWEAVRVTNIWINPYV